MQKQYFSLFRIVYQPYKRKVCILKYFLTLFMQNNNETFWNIEDESDEDFESLINGTQEEIKKDDEPTLQDEILTSENMDFLWSDDEEENVFKTQKNKTVHFEISQDKNNLEQNNTKFNFTNEKGMCEVKKTFNGVISENDAFNNVDGFVNKNISNDATNFTANNKLSEILKAENNKNGDERILSEKIIATQLEQIVNEEPYKLQNVTQEKIKEDVFNKLSNIEKIEEDIKKLSIDASNNSNFDTILTSEEISQDIIQEQHGDFDLPFSTSFENSVLTDGCKHQNNVTVCNNEDVNLESKTSNFIEKEDKQTEKTNLLFSNTNIDTKALVESTNTPNDTELVKNGKGNIKWSSADLTIKKPLVCVFGNSVLSLNSSFQKRYLKDGTQKEVDVNIFRRFKLLHFFEIVDDEITDFFESKSLNLILQLIKLKDIHAESICEVIGAKQVQYSSKTFVDTEKSYDINTALNISTFNNRMAIDYCLKKEMWILALLISKNDPKIIERIFSEILDEDMRFLFCDNTFKMNQPWINYFMHFANSPKSHLHTKYILEVFKNDYTDGCLVLISLFLCNIIDLKDYFEYFTHRHAILQILLIIHKKIKKICGIDILMYEYINDTKERDLEGVKKFYKLYKKEFRKDFQIILDEWFKLNWNFGIKNVLNFGISKILDMPESNDKNNINVVSTHEQKKNIKKSNEYICNVSDQNAHLNPLENQEISHKVDRSIGINENLHENVNKPNKAVYKDNEHSKSFADFFDNDRSLNEDKIEDDTALFLSSFSLNEDDNVDIKKSKSTESDAESNSSFFGIFNLFKKKSYKIDIKASDDIKYDPVAKKWISGSQSVASKQDILNKPQIPVPKIKPNVNAFNTANKDSAVKKNSLDVKKMSLYAGKKKTNIVEFSTIKKDKKM